MWESYSTWLTGFALFAVLYLFNASTFLIDKTVFDWSPAAAIATALAFFVAFWLDLRRHLPRSSAAARTATSSSACSSFAFIVLRVVAVVPPVRRSRRVPARRRDDGDDDERPTSRLVIIPGQRKVVAALREGRPVDPIHGQRGKQRSVHNTYFTLPVVFTMISNHYGFIFGAQHNWLVLVVLMLAGALIRHVVRAAPQGAGRVAAGAVALRDRRHAGAGRDGRAADAGAAAGGGGAAPPPSFAEVQAIVAQRCALCHNATLANKNVRLDSAAEIGAHAQQVYQQAVVLKLMPMSNATQITDAERAALGRWYEAGAAR